MDEARTRQAYEGLLRRRALERSTAPVSLDVVRELAESPTIGDHRLELPEVDLRLNTRWVGLGDRDLAAVQAHREAEAVPA